MDSKELRRLQAKLKQQLSVQQREASLQAHALRMTRMENHRLKVAVALLRRQAGNKQP